MKIAITGATGYVGAHTTSALLADGHTVRILTLPGEPDVAALLPQFAERIETLEGDIRDASSVEHLLEGCDALVHAAGIVGTDDSREQLMWDVNVQATAMILAKASMLGLDPIVHVASFSALFPSPDAVIGPDSPSALARSAYGRSKSAADRMARALQQTGAPIVITYPASVVGPGLGGARGITEQGWGTILKMGVAPRLRGGMQMIDVRDVAAVHAAAMVPGLGPRRYVCGGELIPFDTMVDILERETGRVIRRLPLPGKAFRMVGSLCDVLRPVLPMSAGLSHEAAWLLTSAVPTDDSRTRADLALTWRSPHEALAATARPEGPTS